MRTHLPLSINQLLRVWTCFSIDLCQYILLGLRREIICFVCLFQMASQIKVHRRNKAVGHEDQHFRMSVPPLESSLLRNSYDPHHIPKIDFRNSDANQLHILTPRLKDSRGQEEKMKAEREYQKTGKNLLLTMKGLQMKLAEAKKQLTLEQEEPLCEFSLELGQQAEQLQFSGRGLGDSIFEKLEESTINLESNRKLITVVKSKERLLWSNKVKTYYLKEVVRGLIGINERALEHLTISHQIFYSARTIQLPEPDHRPQFFPINHKTPSHVLVLDLDETLFHCEEHRTNAQDIEVDIPVEGGSEKAFVSIRPYAFSFLKHCKKHFEIIAFTASERCYADAILNEIDPEGEYFSFRLYREHCVKLHNKVYAKDLRIINRDLSKMVLVDNSPLSYLYQVLNGIPILPYYGGEDTELLGLQKYLQKVRVQADVRKLNHLTFKLNQYGSFQDCQSLVKQLYCPPH